MMCTLTFNIPVREFLTNILPTLCLYGYVYFSIRRKINKIFAGINSTGDLSNIRYKGEQNSLI